MTPAQTKAEIATLIRQLQDERQKKRRLRWALRLGVASLILGVVSRVVGDGDGRGPSSIDDHPLCLRLSFFLP
jgi:hypothetical protein